MSAVPTTNPFVEQLASSRSRSFARYADVSDRRSARSLQKLLEKMRKSLAAAEKGTP